MTNEKLSQYIHGLYEKTKQLADQYEIFIPLRIAFRKSYFDTECFFCYCNDSVMYYEYYGIRREESIRYFSDDIDKISFYAMYSDIKEMARLFARRFADIDRAPIDVWCDMFIKLYGTISPVFQKLAEEYIAEEIARGKWGKFEEQYIYFDYKKPGQHFPSLLLPEYMLPAKNNSTSTVDETSN